MKNLPFITILLILINSLLINAQNIESGDFYLNDGLVSDYFVAINEYDSQDITLSATANQDYEFDSWNFLNPIEVFGKKSDWRYLDTGADLGKGWIDTLYDDSSWNTGDGIFGYNNNNETTIIDFGSDSDNKYVTTYFRKSFQVTEPELGRFIKMGIIADDGVVVYLNGEEIIRLNMPSTDISYQTFASGNIPNETEYNEFIVPIESLLTEDNILAVELHQSSFGSSDLSFDADMSLFFEKEYLAPFDVNQNPVTFNVTMDEYVYPTYGLIPVDSTKFFISLTEMMSDNDSTIIDGYLKTSDWIEIYNSSNEAISLNEFTLSDKLDDLGKWSFPEVFIQPQSYMIVFASNEESFESELHTNFKISSSGEPILLSYKGELLETIPSTALESDQSIIKVNGEWQVSAEPSPGAENIRVPNLVQFSNPAGLYPTGFYLKLSDNSVSGTIRYTLDGSTPNQSSLIYTDSIFIQDLTLEPNGIADIPTSGVWEASSVNLLKGTVVKAALFDGAEQLGAIETKTYLVN